MKQKETPPTPTKEGLHTQGEWYVSSILHKDKNMCPVAYHEISVRDGDKSSWWLATVNASENAFSLEESKANAELIVKAVNERKALLDSHREMKSCLERMCAMYGSLLEQVYKGSDRSENADWRESQTAINNAKNI